MQGHAIRPGGTKAAATLLFTVIALSLFLHVESTVVCASTGRVIDLFTQKAPYEGRGANQSSDAFEPQELVVLYALVTYNDNPVANKLVAFQVDGPKNAYENITAAGSSSTNDSGIAEFSFRIPWTSQNPEARVFGEWHAVATVSVADQPIVDTSTFRVAWILKVISIVTLNLRFEPQNRFLRQSQIIFDVVVENIGRLPRTATIVIDALDAAAHPIVHIQLEDLVFQPGQTHINASSQISTEAALGQARAYAAASTATIESGGILYSPAVSTTFEIFTRDVAVTSVTPAKTAANRGEVVQITVGVKNKGNETESFYVTLYYDHLVIDRKYVSELKPSEQRQLVFQWNTTDVLPGSYVITATADKVEGEIDVDDNTYVDGTVAVSFSGPSFSFSLVILLLIFIVVLIAILFLFFLLAYSRRRRRKRKRPQSYYMIVSHPHI